MKGLNRPYMVVCAVLLAAAAIMLAGMGLSTPPYTVHEKMDIGDESWTADAASVMNSQAMVTPLYPHTLTVELSRGCMAVIKVTEQEILHAELFENTAYVVLDGNTLELKMECVDTERHGKD